MRIDEEVEGGVVTLRLNEPGRGNAFQPGDMAILAGRIDAAGRRDDARAIVLTGAGKLFSAGAALDDLGAVYPKAMIDIMTEQTGRLAHAFGESPLPIVTAVNGPVAGAANALVLMADLAVAAIEASFLFPFAALGLVPDSGISLLLPERIGGGRARRVLMTGGGIGTAEAEAWGLIAETVGREELQSTARGLAATLGAMPAGTHRAIRNLSGFSRATIADRLELEAAAQSERLAQPEVRRAVAIAIDRLMRQ